MSCMRERVFVLHLFCFPSVNDFSIGNLIDELFKELSSGISNLVQSIAGGGRVFRHCS